MPPDPHLHEFTMIQRAIRATAAKGMYDEAQRLLTKLLEIAPDNTNYSRTKWRFPGGGLKTPRRPPKRGLAPPNPNTPGSETKPPPFTTARAALVARAEGDAP